MSEEKRGFRASANEFAAADHTNVIDARVKFEERRKAILLAKAYRKPAKPTGVA
jgi:hypothetical protein